MRRFLIVLALAAAAGSAFASDDEVRIDAPRDRWLPIARIIEKFTSQGYDVREVEVEEGGYEISAVGKDGKRLKTRVHPVTGEILKNETDD